MVATATISSSAISSGSSGRVRLGPLFGLVVYEVRPLLAFKEGTDTLRAKLAEAQEAMAAA